MFTGIIEIMGTVTAFNPLDPAEVGSSEWAKEGGYSLTIGNAASVLTDVHIGDSIAVNGVCLTVISFGTDWFKVGIMNESLRKTNVGDLRPGDSVNLERAMLGSTRVGGHYVQGHVDATATLTRVEPDGNALTFELRLDGEARALAPYIIPKGYIALDGTSLTVVDVLDARHSFTISMIAHTQKSVVLATKKAGDRVNVEVDMMGKYVERVVLSMFGVEAAEGVLASMVDRAVEKALAKRN
ncbi:hypothetical protein BC828DRAFT_363563 [Blastocladiella britannica]|nr:hypothetical protein BC828DRAFT_363563 [Blastocladiella britannica]